MAFCEQCGARLNELAKFCGKCGTPTEAARNSVIIPAGTVQNNDEPRKSIQIMQVMSVIGIVWSTLWLVLLIGNILFLEDALSYYYFSASLIFKLFSGISSVIYVYAIVQVIVIFVQANKLSINTVKFMAIAGAVLYAGILFILSNFNSIFNTSTAASLTVPWYVGLASFFTYSLVFSVVSLLKSKIPPETNTDNAQQMPVGSNADTL